MTTNLILFGVFALGFILGGISTYIQIRQYRKRLGYKPSPFEPENIYLM